MGCRTFISVASILLKCRMRRKRHVTTTVGVCPLIRGNQITSHLKPPSEPGCYWPVLVAVSASPAQTCTARFTIACFIEITIGRTENLFAIFRANAGTIVVHRNE